MEKNPIEPQGGLVKKSVSKILIIDDQAANLKILGFFLSEHNFVVSIAENGGLALELLEQQYQPDIILLDILMPGMNGFETCRRIKANSKTVDIPVLFMTALNSVEDKVAGFEAGGVDYITKPFQQAEVVARLDLHLTLQRQKKELEKALADIKTLSGMLNMCSICKRIKDKDGSWIPLERYLAIYSGTRVSHGLCSDCVITHYKEFSE